MISKQLVVLLHGYGANGESLSQLGNNWSKVLPNAEFISPNGIEVLNSYTSGYGWFPWVNFDAANVRPGLEKSALALAAMINQWLQERNLTAQELAIVGFSQGMMVALELMFYLPEVSTIIGYSGAFYPPSVNTLGDNTPHILLVHGDADSGVPYSFFEEAGHQLTQLGLFPQLETRPDLNHRIDQQGIELGGAFLRQNFGNASS
jgi:phospholipase/carboxylesterase